MQLNNELNELLVDTFNVILKSEEHSLRKSSNGLSISEYHLIEIIAKQDRSTISSIAAACGITMPSVTVAVKKLEQKGYVEKIKSEEDGRSISVELTKKGKEVNHFHQRFHMHMISKITNQLNNEEKELLNKIVLKLNRYFKKALEVGNII